MCFVEKNSSAMWKNDHIFLLALSRKGTVIDKSNNQTADIYAVVREKKYYKEP